MLLRNPEYNYDKRENNVKITPSLTNVKIDPYTHTHK